MTRVWTVSTATFAAAAAAIGASACCAGPLILVLLGIGGAWGARLMALDQYQGYFLLTAAACFGYSLYSLYFKPTDCAPSESCAVPIVRKRQRVIFWIVLVLALSLVALPFYAPFFY